jgi:hypothetical protein
MRKWCAVSKIKRHLRRLMRNATRHVAQRTLYKRDLQIEPREESGDI